MKVTNERIFSVPEHYFGISGSVTGYTLNYSVDGLTWAAWEEATPAGETLFVANAPLFGKYKLVGNQGDVEVRW